MNLKSHVEQELNTLLQYEQERRKSCTIEELEKEAEIFEGCTPQEYINRIILKIIKPFYDSDLSESSIDYLLDVVCRLVKFQNLSPLTLADDEFVKVADDNGEDLYQNIRNCLVFKTKSKGIYHLDGQKYLDIACGKFNQDETNQDNFKQLSIYDLGVEDTEGSDING